MGSNSLDKARRIIHNNEYRLVYKHGKFEVGRMCVLYRMPVAKQPTRIGFVTGKRLVVLLSAIELAG